MYKYKCVVDTVTLINSTTNFVKSSVLSELRKRKLSKLL